MTDFQPRMEYVRLDKTTLIDVLVTNRDKHRAAFDEAVHGYRAKAQEVLQRNLNNIANNIGVVEIRLGLVVPVEHTRDYDRTISLLELSLDDEIYLTEREFAQYVMDDWGWQQEFTATNVMYSGQ